MNDKIKLHDLLVRSSDFIIRYQNDDGSFPPGHNGPYNDPETPVRNTSHWLITLLKSYKISGEAKYFDAANKAADYLSSDEARPYGYTFHHRNIGNKDCCNGLIGQAWTIEALAVASETLDRPELSTLAKEVFTTHPFDHNIGLWRRVEIDGEDYMYDETFNHQLWFAAAGAILLSVTRSDTIRSQLKSFIQNLDSHLQLHENGLIKHHIGYDFDLSMNLLNNVWNRRMVRAKIREKVRAKTKQNYWGDRHKEIGYHAFNLYGLALLNHNMSSNVLDLSVIKKITEYTQRDEFRKEVLNNKYGFPYNPSGFEIAYALEEFSPSFEQEQWWVSQQIKNNYVLQGDKLAKNTQDRKTLSARIYEATRLPNMEIVL